MDDFMEEVIQRIPIRDYKFDAPWQAAARRKQSDFREKEMRVPAVPNTEKSGCYGVTTKPFRKPSKAIVLQKNKRNT